MNKYKKKRLDYTAFMIAGAAIVVIDASLLTEDSAIHLLIRLSGALLAFVSFFLVIRMFVKENSHTNEDEDS